MNYETQSNEFSFKEEIFLNELRTQIVQPSAGQFQSSENTRDIIVQLETAQLNEAISPIAVKNVQFEIGQLPIR